MYVSAPNIDLRVRFSIHNRKNCKREKVLEKEQEKKKKKKKKRKGILIDRLFFFSFFLFNKKR